MSRSEFPRLKSGDALEPWHLNAIYRELERWNKAGAGGGIAFQNRAGGPYWSLVAGLGLAVIKATGTLTARAGANPGSGPATVQDYDSGTNTLSDSATTISAVRNLFDAVPSGSYTLAVSALGEWWNVPLGGSGSGGDAPLGRCDCPESHYEVTTNCGPCRVMPKYWWLTITTASLHSGESECATTDCADLVGLRFRLANSDDPDEAGCVWETLANGCVTAELAFDAANDRWKLTLTDSTPCVLGIWYCAREDFECCATNATWTADAANKCDVTFTLDPDPCTCCPADPVECPPDGGRLCENSPCCFTLEGGCSFTITVTGAEDPDPMTHVENPQNCINLNGDYPMLWVGDCTWTGIRTDGSGNIYRATLTLAGNVWTLVIIGPGGQTATFTYTGCGPSISMNVTSTSCEHDGGGEDTTITAEFSLPA